jgi:hypothetical protein
VNSYSLTVINNSEQQKPTFALFATLPVDSSNASLALAWITQQIDTHNHYTFTWNIEWGFAWAGQGTDEGVQWSAGGSLPADPLSSNGCAAELAYDNDFSLTPSPHAATGDKLWITDAPTVPVPSKQACSVGVSLNGSPACVIDAGPNLTQTFTLHPTYYIDAGEYATGQMVDGSSVTAFQKVAFANGVYALTATLNQDNTWSMKPTAEVNIAKLLKSAHRGRAAHR